MVTTGLPDDDRRAPFLMNPANVQQPVRIGSLDDEHDFDAVIRQVRPRPEIILRWKRFGLLMLLAVTLLASINAVFMVGIVVGEREKESQEVEDETKRYNNISGVCMGFAEAVVGELLKFLFPVFIVYLHNVHWFRGDDPASKPTPKLKRIALMLFFPLLMIAIGSSLSSVQTNIDDGEESDKGSARRLLEADASFVVARPTASRVDDSVLRSVLSPPSILRLDNAVSSNCAGSTKDSMLHQLPRAVMSSRLDAKVAIHDWSAELVAAVANAQSSSSVAASTANRIIEDGLQVFQRLVVDSGVMIKPPVVEGGVESVADAAVSAFRSMGENVTAGLDLAGLQVKTQRLDVHTAIHVESVTVTIPKRSEEPVACGTRGCLSFDDQSLLRRRVRQQVVWTRGAAAHSALVVAFTAPVSHTPSLQWTFTKLAWSLTPESSLVLPLELSKQKIVLTPELEPSASSQSPVLLAQLLEPPLQWRPQSRAPVDIVLHRSAQASPAASTACVDSFIDEMTQRRLFFGVDEAQRTTTSLALLALFEATHPVPIDALVQDASPAVAWSRRRLEEQSSKDDVGSVYVSNTEFGKAAAYTSSGLIVVLVAIVLVFPNARARLEPPKGGNVRAERFVAVQTEETYPNFVYKKRIRGRDAKKVKFREYAVESVTLHHRMEESVQVHL
ncbi:hypothetical protein P43SY_005661 [Pythium insidiosum]|uniref:Transmembrane protein n=1 Tax=Pythium insidiosum TaxID=114742 RepID=A0AAD5Q5R0_PYTIN|nr:hypothetical protein P43SY_005661 [Pythium insidiosum]